MSHRIEELTGAGLHEAQCLFDPELHDGPAFEAPAARAAREDVARQVCQACPVQAACAALMLGNRRARGVWAGVDAAESAAPEGPRAGAGVAA